MRTIKYLIAFVCLSSIAHASCSADDSSCEDPIMFDSESTSFFISNFSPSNGEENVLLDTTIRMQFSDSVPVSQGLHGFFFLLNQFTGVTTEIPASCIVVKNSYTLEVPVLSCLGDVLEANTVYAFYVAQRFNGNVIETLTSIKNMQIHEKAFDLQYKSIVFRTIDNIAAEVVKEKCVPAFNAADVSLTANIEIAFSSAIHLGSGVITLVSTKYGADITVDVTDANHCVIREDSMSLLLFGFSFLGSETYQVTFPAGIVLSASGSKCGTVSDFFFTTMADTEKPYILFTTPAMYSNNLPTNTIVRVAFSEYMRPNTGSIVFKNTQKDILVNVESEKEVRCVKDVCMIEPMYGFEPGTYEMIFGETAFVDYSGNSLVRGMSGHIFVVSDTKCGLEFVNVQDNTECFCQSKDDQCQCQCGETFFVKDY